MMAQNGPLLHTEPSPPSNGVGHIISGSILTGLGGLNLLTAPLCMVDTLFSDTDTQYGCLYASLIVGGTLTAVGIPLLVIGVNKRQRYKKWLEERTTVAALSRFSIIIHHNGSGLFWRGAF
jgi:hypothetical protein